MGIFKREKKESKNTDSTAVAQTSSVSTHPFWSNLYSPMNVDKRIYRALREGVPIIDSAIQKIVRLVGDFEFVTGNEQVDAEMKEFFDGIMVGGNQKGIHAFVDNFLDQLLTYGTAIGEMLCDRDGFYALYNGELDALEVKRKQNSIELEFFNSSSGVSKPIQNPERILFSVLNPEPDKILGTSLLRGIPFVADILLKIYNTIGVNFERCGNLRYAVTYKPQADGNDKAFAKERALQMADAWKEAMSSKDSVKDFVAVGDVKVSVIGADNQVLDAEIPSRLMLEQIIAKTGLMPYMFGLSWSTTERMSQQQADILTTELESYRRIITPVLKQIAKTYLHINCVCLPVDVKWEDITLQDATQLAQARLYNAEADKLLREAEDE